jgi:mannose-6-phosphate isomerase-like protein (cupin superfamily)
VSLREDGCERTVGLYAGDIFFVPRGTEHKPSSSGGSILHAEHRRPARGEIPAHVDSTVGHDIADERAGG